MPNFHCHLAVTSRRYVSIRLTVLFLLAVSLGLPQATAPRLFAAPAQQTAATPTATAAVQTNSVIQRIRTRDNTLVAGVEYDFEPFGFINEQGDVAGFDVDLVRAIAEVWGVKLDFVQVNASNRVQFLTTGAVDLVAAALTHTQATAANLDFSQTYFLDGQSLLVRANANISDMQDLAGKTVAAVQGSPALDVMRAFADKNRFKLSVLPFQEYPPALAALKAGQVDALTAGSAYLVRAAQTDPALQVVGNPFSAEPYGIGLPQDDAYFRDLVNATLQTLKTNGTYDRLYAKWFPGESPYPLEVLPGQWPYTFATSPITLTKPAETRQAVIRQRGKVLIGVKYDFPPFGFVDAEGNVRGFDVDLAHEFAARWLGSPDAVELVPVTSDTRIPFLANGAVDLIIASMTHTQPRASTIDFSETYFLDGQKLLVRKDSGITDLASLNGKSVAAVVGSTSIDNMRASAAARHLSITILPFQEYPSALQALKAGQVDALTTDGTALAQFAQDNPTLAVVGEPFSQEPYGIGVPQFDSVFRNLVDTTLQAMQQDGTYATLYHKWFGPVTPYPIESWPGAPTALLNSPTTTPVSSRALTATPTRTTAPTSQPTKTPQRLLILIPTATPTSTVTTAPPSSATPTATPISIEEPDALATPVIHTIVEGETLGTLAQRYYGKYALWTKIYEANRDKIGDDPNHLAVGMELLIPAAP